MSRFAWINQLWKPSKHGRRKQQGLPWAERFRPRLEALEERLLLSGQAYVVDRTGDSGAGSGLTGDIRYCVNQADLTANAGSTITFDTAKTGNSITLKGGPLVISDQLTITGPGAGSLTISGNKSSRLFDVSNGGSLTLTNVTLSGGLAKGTGAAAEGGAIYSSGTLTLSGVTMKSNEAVGSNGAAGKSGAAGGNGASAFGGGIYVAAGSVTLNNDILSSNTVLGGKGGKGGGPSINVHTGLSGGSGGAGSGGGLYVATGTATLTNDTLSSNNATGGNGSSGGNGGPALGGGSGGSGGNGGAGSGGGLYVAAGTVMLTNDTLSSNNANGGGGAEGGPSSAGNKLGKNGSAGAGSGGGVYVVGGSVTLTDDTLGSNNAVGGIGCGIALGDAAPGGSGGAGTGGGLDVEGGNVTMNNDAFSSNNAKGGRGGAGGFGSPGPVGGTGGNGGAGSGGGLYVAAGTATLTDDTLNSNNALGGEGGIGGGNLDGACGIGGSGSAGSGGGVYAAGTVTLTNDTLSSNNATGGNGGSGGFGASPGSAHGGNGGSGSAGSGGGVYAAVGAVTLTNDTLSTNNANGGKGGSGGLGGPGAPSGSNGSSGSGGAGTGGGSVVVSGAKELLHNTLIAGNLADGKPADVSGSLNSAGDYNLIGDGSGGLSAANHNLLGTSASLLNPLLAPLANYGGTTETMALFPGSPAIDAGSAAYGGNTDQRGKPRNSGTDIGAFQSQGFTLAIGSGNNQSTTVNTAFAQPLMVSVTANNAIEPVVGGVISFQAPTSGPSAVLSGNSATISSKGQAGVTATANANSGTYIVSASATGVASSANFTLTNSPPTVAPSITSQPTSETAVAGQTATFTASASGSPAPTVQWKVSSDGGKTFSNISGATNTTLALNSVTLAMNGDKYEAVFTNSVGTATTSAATLTVTSAPVITVNPSSQTVTAGQPATFTASASGSPTPTVQWQVSTDGGKTFSNISGATSTSLTLNKVATAMNGNEYKAVFTNSVGSVTTAAATLTVTTAPTITGNPSSVSLVSTQTAIFTASANGNPTPTVQWQVSTDGGETFTNIPGATSTTLTLDNVATAMNGNEYQAVFTNSAGTVTSNAATLTVQAPPIIPPRSLPNLTPVLNTPPLLSLLNSIFGGGTVTVNADGSETVTDSFFGIPLLVSNFDSSGNLVSVTLFGIDITFVFSLL